MKLPSKLRCIYTRCRDYITYAYIVAIRENMSHYRVFRYMNLSTCLSPSQAHLGLNAPDVCMCLFGDMYCA